MIAYEWRGRFASTEVSALHAEAFVDRAGQGGAGDRGAGTRDWQDQVRRHSLGWVCARDGGDLAGFVNVAWNGGVHAFILDTMVAAGMRRRGIGTGLVAVAVREARRAGCEWLHVDFEEHLRPFYVNGCGFTPSSAGLLAL
ncbi:MAG: GNAT family N-acetyltransferase [Streptosporangiaceae bacterium]